MSFANLEQRLAQGYIDMLPSFVPDENAPVSVSEQEQFYEMIKGLFQLALNEPLLFVPSLHEDDVYPNRFKKSYGKPKLIADMRKFIKSIDELLQAMFLLGRGEEVKLNTKQKAALSRLGTDDLTSLPAAWKWMSTKDGASISAFSHCMFNDNYPYASEIYARLLGESAFKRLENWMLSQGYKRHNIYKAMASECNLLLSIANPKWSEEPPRGGHEYKIKHTGISAQYDYYVKDPAIFGLCIPNGLGSYLLAFDKMSPVVQNFVMSRVKRCDGCRYCVQTDKTGSRPLAAIEIVHQGEQHSICPYFPGYYFSWTSIDDELVEQLIEMLSFMDRFAKG